MTTLFNIGDVVIVGRGLPPGHVRTPMFLRGRKGKIIKYFGSFPNPERLAYGLSGLPKINLYQVLFAICLLYTSPSPRDRTRSRMPSSA